MKPMKIQNLITWMVVLSAMIIPLYSAAQTHVEIDGKQYKTIQIGKQVWTAENLDVTHFRNGDPIPQAKTPEEWKEASATGKPAWCYYENKDSIGALYGKLYNWYAITDARGLVPEGWHIPTSLNWSTTTKYLGGVDYAGVKMKSTTRWSDRNKGSNASKFDGYPGGIRNEDGVFSNINHAGQWWSVSPNVRDHSQIYSFKLHDSFEVFYVMNGKGAGLSVRAVKD